VEKAGVFLFTVQQIIEPIKAKLSTSWTELPVREAYYWFSGHEGRNFVNRLLSGAAIGAVLLLVTACGGASSTVAPPEPQPAGLLSKVSDPADLEASIKSGFNTIRSTEEVALTAGAAADSRNFTGTYTQEKNVDEFDAVRYDGTYLYIAPRRFMQCCYLLADAAQVRPAGPAAPPEQTIRILQTDPASGSATLRSSIALERNISVQGMYVADNTLFALTGESIFGSYGDLWADFAIWAPEQLGYRVYDVSDPASPALEFDAKIDGVFIESRRIGNVVYIVSRYTPWIQGLEYYVTTAEQQANNQSVLADVLLDDLLPKITINGTTQTLVDPARCYLPTVGDAGYPVITSVTAVPIDDPAAFTTTCYNAESYGIYLAENALYFTELRYESATTRNQTRIHKFSLAGADLQYKGSVDIRGQVWRGGQADFRMSEYNGDLRVLSSEFDWNNVDSVDHRLYVLRESSTRPALEILSELPNQNRPEKIGKPNEALYGVRFLAERAYAVTFEQIDPLYAIDLTDPADPFIAGELTVTGFSDFLHPVNDDLLLGLGTGENGGIKIELFDVSSISQPLSRGTVLLGGRGSNSPATYDRHAFTYQADVNGIDRFTIPANVYSTDNSYTLSNSGLYLFEIRAKDMPNLASLNSVGAIIPPSDGANLPYINRDRAFIHDDTVYYIRNELVWAAFWNSPLTVNGPF
jgi:beta propeller domain-containing protein